jgi:hypothetical protein
MSTLQAPIPFAPASMTPQSQQAKTPYSSSPRGAPVAHPAPRTPFSNAQDDPLPPQSVVLKRLEEACLASARPLALPLAPAIPKITLVNAASSPPLSPRCSPCANS